MDFLGQIISGVIFFFILAGVGWWAICQSTGGRMNVWISLGVGYFFSLAVYVFLCSIILLIPGDKRLFLLLLSFSYAFISLVFVIRALFRQYATKEKPLISSRRALGTFSLFVLFLVPFYLGAYNTSMLDEWLHRPVVKYFDENGSYPFVNPYNPEQDFVHLYHVGTYFPVAFISLLPVFDISQSLDVFKFSVAIASIILLYGIFLEYDSKSKGRRALLFSILVFYAGGSFFFYDVFSTTHLFRWGEGWAFNVPLSFNILGVTWTGIPVSLAMLMYVKKYLFDFPKVIDWKLVMMTIIFAAGFSLINEYFFVLSCVGIMALLIKFFQQKKLSWGKISGFLGSSIIIFLFFSFISGGVIGGLLRGFFTQATTPPIAANVTVQEGDRQEGDDAPAEADQSVVVEAAKAIKVAPLLQVKSPGEWGYSTDKKRIPFFANPSSYVRNFLFECLAVGLFFILLFKKEGTKLSSLVWFSMFLLLLPFFFTTRYGDLNLLKSITLGILLLHVWAAVSYFTLSDRWKVVKYGILILLIFAALPNVLHGPNVQWRFISSSVGKSQYCSQNPRCYNEEIQALMERTDKGNPQVKLIAAAPKDQEKVVTLSNSVTMNALALFSPSGMTALDAYDGAFLLVSPGLEAKLTVADLGKIGFLEEVDHEGRYSLRKIK